jgi:hypothetical protein
MEQNLLRDLSWIAKEFLYATKENIRMLETMKSKSRLSHQDHSEGTLAQMIEDQTARLPSDAFLWTAVGSMGVSLALQMAGKRHMGNFVGQWVPTILILGVYNKIVKTLGSD